MRRSWRCAAARQGRQAGFAPVEPAIGISLVMIVTDGVTIFLTPGLNSQRESRDRTSAEQAAPQELESVRQMAFSDVGISGGSPNGLIPATVPVMVGGGRDIRPACAGERCG